MTVAPTTSPRTPINDLIVIASVATFAGRAAPIPDATMALLKRAADDALDFIAARVAEPSIAIAEQMLVDAAFAAIAFPRLQAPLTALGAAVELLYLLRPEPEQQALERWEIRAGLMG